MQSIIQLLVHDKSGVISQYNVASDAAKTGSQLVIKATGKVAYELKDTNFNVAPNQIIAKRKGKNLEINLDVDGSPLEANEAPDIIIENYYDESASKLIGLAEDGNYYPYVPQEGETSLLTYNMTDGVFSYQSLGKLDNIIAPLLTSPSATGTIGFGALEVGAITAIIGGIAAVTGGGGGKEVTNIPPTATGNTSGDEDTNISIALAGIDTDGTIDHITVVTLPLATQGVLYYSDGITPVIAGTALTPAEAANLVFTPTLNFNGTVTIQFTATDNAGASSPVTDDVITIVPVNDPVILTVTPVATLTEDSVMSGTVVATSVATDQDGGAITYSIDDTTNYAINPTTGEVTLTATGAAIVNSGANLPNFNITAASTTGETSTTTVPVNPADTTTVNDPVILTVTPVATLTEDSVMSGTVVATSVATDQDGGAITYSIDDTTNYAINPTTGGVTLTAAGAAIVNSGANLPNFNVTAASTTGETSTTTVPVNPADTTTVNDPVILTVTPVAPLTEDSVMSGTVVATSVATDQDGGAITYSIDDTTNYAINPTTGEVTLTAAGAAIVNSGANLPNFNITAASTTGETSTTTVPVNPADTTTVNDPVILTVTPVATLTEDSVMSGTVVATSVATDQDGGAITYSIDDTTNYAINPTTGGVTLTAAGAAIVNSGANLPNFNVTAASTTGETSTTTVPVNPADTTTVNDAPVAVDDHTNTCITTPTITSITTFDTLLSGGTVTAGGVDITATISSGNVQTFAGDGTLSQGAHIGYFTGADFNEHYTSSMTLNFSQAITTLTLTFQAAQDEERFTFSEAATSIINYMNSTYGGVPSIMSTATLENGGLEVRPNLSADQVDMGVTSESFGSNFSVTWVFAAPVTSLTINHEGIDRPNYPGNDNGATNYNGSIIVGEFDFEISSCTTNVTEDTVFNSIVSLIANDTDSDGDTLTAVAGTYVTAQGGTIVIATDGSYIYTPPANFSGTDTVDYTVTDGSLNDVGTLTIVVAAVNDAPINTVPVAQTTNEDTAIVITGLSISDVDASSSSMTVTLSVTNGTLAVVGGTATISGSGTSTVTLTGTVAQINATLSAANGVTYNPTANYNGGSTLTMTTSDNGNTGSGGTLTDSDTVGITVVAVNDAPIWAAPFTATTVTEGDSALLNGKNLSVSDIDAGSGVVNLTISNTDGSTMTVAAGASGISIVSGNGTGSVVVSGTMAQINALLASTGANGTITLNQSYTPATAEGLTSTNVTLALNDLGNTGGGNLIATKTVAITVTPQAETTVGTSAANTLYGGGANDTIIGGGNADTIYGGAGDDVLIGDTSHIRNGSFEFWTGAKATTTNVGDYFFANGSTLPGVSFLNFAPDIGYLGTWKTGQTNDAGREWVTGTASVPYQAGLHVSDVGVSAALQGGNTFTNILTGAGESYNVKFMLTDFDIGQAGVGEVWEVIWNGVTVAEVSNAGAVTSPISGISGSSVSLGDIDNSGTLNTMRDYTISGLITDATGNNTLTLQQKTGAANARDLDYVRIEGTGASVGGNDILNGGTGIDRIFGGEGNDTLTGGAGADRFVYSQMINNGADTITDFLVGTDKIILADLLPLNNLAAQSMSSVASPDIVVGDLINSVATTGHITMNQTVTWTDATHTLTMAGTGSSITFTGMTVSYANATLFLNANAILTGDSFNSVI